MLPPTPSRARARHTVTAIGMSAVLGLAVAACGGSTDPSDMSGMEHATTTSAHPAPGMPNMGDMPAGDGLTAESSGFRFAPAASTLPAGQPAPFGFRILGANDKPVTAFEPDQSKLMHFYLIRSDLTGFQHAHPTMSTDGTWTAPLAPTQPGTYRAYTSFIVKDTSGTAKDLVLSQQITVPGTAQRTPLPAASNTTETDGYTLTLANDQLMAGREHTLRVTVSKDGTPVTDLQPYLDTYAHLTAVHDGDLAFAHLHPQGTVNGDHGGPTLSFTAMLPKPGNWRLFQQFQTGGVLHTAAVTISVG